MHAFIVVPCFNEENSLAATCASLGFGKDQSPPEHVGLVLVDNGSTDRTRSVMEAVRDQSPLGLVTVTYEPERGFVPPRRRGIEVAGALADAAAIDRDAVLVVQADADTLYGPGHVVALMSAAKAAGPNALVEGTTAVPPEFAAVHSDYLALCAQVDAAVRDFCVPQADDVIVDDKVCAYRLADYLAWGEHQREYDPDSEEIHAETSRLYMRARTFGARKVPVDAAIAWPSRRKIYEHPALYFITDGFPHGGPWSARWRQVHPEMTGFDALSAPGSARTEAIFLRQAHELILFGVLPTWIAGAVGPTSTPSPLAQRLAPLVDSLPALTPEFLRSSPGRALWIAMNLIEKRPDDLKRFLLGNAALL
jgi:hypothetical protein